MTEKTYSVSSDDIVGGNDAGIEDFLKEWNDIKKTENIKPNEEKRVLYKLKLKEEEESTAGQKGGDGNDSFKYKDTMGNSFWHLQDNNNTTTNMIKPLLDKTIPRNQNI